MKVQPLKFNFTTAREQAEYYFNREFKTISYSLIEESVRNGTTEIMMPSTEIIIQEYFDSYSNKNDILEEYYGGKRKAKKHFDSWINDEDFIKWAEDQDWFDNYKYGDLSENHYPMWGWVFGCDSFYVDSDYMNVDKLWEIGIGVLDHEDGYFLFIAGAGYDFYEAHWIKLFKEIGWISEQTEEQAHREKVEEEIQNLRHYLVPFSSLDIATAVGVAIKVGENGEWLGKQIEEHCESFGVFDFQKIDCVYVAYEAILQFARTEISEFTGFDIQNDANFDTLGNYMATQYDFSEKSFKDLRKTLKNVPGPEAYSVFENFNSKTIWFLQHIGIEIPKK